MLLWRWLFWKLEQASCSIWPKYCQVTQWLDCVLCRMSGHLGIQIADTSCIVHYQSGVNCHVSIPTRRTSHYVSGPRNLQEGFSSHLYQALCILQVFGDISCALELARLPKLCPCAKHINISYHHFCKHLRKGLIKIFPVGTRNQMTDALTKDLPQKDFQRHRCYMCGLYVCSSYHCEGVCNI